MALLAAPALFAQGYETKLGTETVEMLGGVIYRNGDGRADAAMGTRLLSGLNRWVSLYGEYSYTRLISEEFHADPLQGICRCGVKEEVRDSIMDFGGGGELHLSGYRIQPYLVAGIGSVRISAKAAVGAFKATVSEYHFGSSFGGGVRLFATRNVGFSAEAKTVTIHDGGRLGRFERYALGVFYQQPARR